MTDNEPRFDMWYFSEGVSITRYEYINEELVVSEEWWYTWPEVFAQLTGVEGYSPHIYSEK